MANKEEIQANTAHNIARVKNLARIYKEGRTGSGRRPVAASDVLRAATVMLHASLEDFLRDLARWKMPIAAADYLGEIPISGSDGKNIKFTLTALAKFRGQSVNDVISGSVVEHLAKVTYNNISDIKKLLKAIGQDDTKINKYASLIGEMMERRHNIVHKADKNESTGVGHYSAKSLSHETVIKWVNCVEEFVGRVLDDV